MHDRGPVRLARLSFEPAPFYCEENVWQLCADPRVDGEQRVAIFMSNPARQVAVARQRVARSPELPVVWDYHVVLAARPRGAAADRWMVWDPDTTLGLPTPLGTYLRDSLAFPRGFAPPHEAAFRMIEASRYRERLRTDRRHMLDASGRLRAPAPAWPPIGEGSNLMRFVDMRASFEGRVVDLASLPGALLEMARARGDAR